MGRLVKNAQGRAQKRNGRAFNNAQESACCCVPTTGACCRPNGLCAPNVTQLQCINFFNGIWMGPGTICTPNLCPCGICPTSPIVGGQLVFPVPTQCRRAFVNVGLIVHGNSNQLLWNQPIAFPPILWTPNNAHCAPPHGNYCWGPPWGQTSFTDDPYYLISMTVQLLCLQATVNGQNLAARWVLAMGGHAGIQFGQSVQFQGIFTSFGSCQVPPLCPSGGNWDGPYFFNNPNLVPLPAGGVGMAGSSASVTFTS